MWAGEESIHLPAKIKDWDLRCSEGFPFLGVVGGEWNKVNYVCDNLMKQIENLTRDYKIYSIRMNKAENMKFLDYPLLDKYSSVLSFSEVSLDLDTVICRI